MKAGPRWPARRLPRATSRPDFAGRRSPTRRACSVSAPSRRARTTSRPRRRGTARAWRAASPSAAGGAVRVDFVLKAGSPQGIVAPAAAPSEKPAPKAGPRFQIYGFAALNLIYDLDQMNPDWYDMERPSKLPSFPNEFGENGNFWASVRNSRFGVRSWLPTGLGEVRTEFEFDLVGVGADAGQTTFHLRQAWGALGPFLAGQTFSVFMDADIMPRSLEFWGPSGMVYYRNIQLRWTPIQGEKRLLFALERPGGERRQRRVQGPDRAAGHPEPLPVPGLHGPVPLRRVLGSRADRRTRSLHRMDRHLSRRITTCPGTRSAGA